MTVTEMQSHARPTVRWTEVCAVDHRGQFSSAGVAGAELPVRSGRPPRRSVVRPEGSRPAAASTRSASTSAVAGRAESGRAVSTRAESLVRPRVPARPASTTSVAPGRHLLVRTVASDRARACRVDTPISTGVVDDVPTWALMACGIAFGVIMLLAVAFLGGPAYA